jgi:hypothetical protein
MAEYPTSHTEIPHQRIRVVNGSHDHHWCAVPRFMPRLLQGIQILLADLYFDQHCPPIDAKDEVWYATAKRGSAEDAHTGMLTKRFNNGRVVPVNLGESRHTGREDVTLISLLHPSESS